MRMAHAVVVFDGECALCNGFVAWLVVRDRAGTFLIAGSAGEAGGAALDAAGLPRSLAASTLVVWDGHKAFTRSDAVAAVASGLPWPWRAGAVVRWVPRIVRDGVYDFVAARRPKQAAEDAACGVPPAHLINVWRSRLATVDSVAALSSSPQASAALGLKVALAEA